MLLMGEDKKFVEESGFLLPQESTCRLDLSSRSV